METCAIIPAYNHSEKLAGIVATLIGHGLPCLLVDDGSDYRHAAAMRELAEITEDLELLSHAQNRGKGEAVKTGLRAAWEQGFTHALQIDADGQHDLAVLADFLEASRRRPNHLICGRPMFDHSIPKSRYFGRYLTHVWVWINTGSLAIPDAMCGFRIYPLAPVIDLMNRAALGSRMEFDIEILVRANWRGIPMLWLPVAVHYSGASHFRPWEDNWRISRTHAKLFFSRLSRLGRGPVGFSR